MIRRNRSAIARLAVAAVMGLALAGCSKIGESYQRGYILDEAALASVKKGTSAEQVLHTLGTPSTVSTVGNKTWYYISENSHRKAQFLPEKTDDRRVTAIYFNSAMRVERTALYGLQDGVVFDFISRSTPAAGVEQNFVGQLFRGLTRFDPITTN
ncbi:outer membrane protein assembly factor BamE [Microvirga sp. W0021]|uniref:Outer membrane protein assembly factor BamE n=1 Tax=Hohaiivirga grylli TaxID=3133970 RepID=A0ABV0BIC9_9HYPH